MKVAISAIGKLENKYIREWVEYNKLIGIDKIFLYDNNDTWGEYFQDVIKDYIDSDFVSIIDYRGKKVVQCESYQKTLSYFYHDYDFICFIDCDEFITFTKVKNIKEYLSNGLFNNFDIIKLNFLAYGDNELLDNNSNSVLNTFIKPLQVDHKGPLEYPNNLHSKCIINCKNYKNRYGWCGSNEKDGRNGDPHIPIINQESIKCCDNRGVQIKPMSICPLNYDDALIRHYSTKTIKEFALTKFRRGFPDQVCKYKVSDYIKNIGTFFSFNRATNKKLDLLSDITKDLYDTENNKVVAEARGRIGNTMFTIAAGAFYAKKNNKDFYLYIDHKMAQYPKKFKDGTIWYYTDWLMSNKLFENIKTTSSLDILNYSRIDCYEKNSNTYNKLPYVNNCDLYIHGFRQSPKYFTKQFVRRLFKPSKELIDKINNYVKCNLEEYVSVNIRRGDFTNPANSWIMYLSPKEWFYKVMNEYDENQKFLIVTDDINWAKEEFSNKENCKVLDYNEDDKEFVDLFAQTLCKDNIISNSTFSWWAAYLNIHDNRKVYYHSPWFINEQGDGDIIPENDNWIDIR